MFRGVELILLVFLVSWSGATSAVGKNEELLRAAWEGRTEDVQKFIAEGVDVNAANGQGRTALMWAASYGQDLAVQMLLDKGADPRVKDVDGVTAAGWAAKNGRDQVARLLREAEKQRVERSKQ